MLTSLGSIPRVPTYHRLLLCHLMSGDSWTTWPRLTDCQVSNSHIKALSLHFLHISHIPHTNTPTYFPHSLAIQAHSQTSHTLSQFKQPFKSYFLIKQFCYLEIFSHNSMTYHFFDHPLTNSFCINHAIHPSIISL